MPQLTLKVDLGHVLTILVLILGLAVGWGQYSSDMAYIKKTLEEQAKAYRATQDEIRELYRANEHNKTLIESHVAQR